MPHFINIKPFLVHSALAMFFVQQVTSAAEVIHSVGVDNHPKSKSAGVARVGWQELITAGSKGVEVSGKAGAKPFRYRMILSSSQNELELGKSRLGLLSRKGGKSFQQGDRLKLSVDVLEGDVRFAGFTGFTGGSFSVGKGVSVNGVEYLKTEEQHQKRLVHFKLPSSSLNFDVSFLNKAIYLRWVDFKFDTTSGSNSVSASNNEREKIEEYQKDKTISPIDNNGTLLSISGVSLFVK